MVLDLNLGTGYSQRYLLVILIILKWSSQGGAAVTAAVYTLLKLPFFHNTFPNLKIHTIVPSAPEGLFLHKNLPPSYLLHVLIDS